MEVYYGKSQKKDLIILLTLLILFSSSVVTFAYSQEVPEPFINVGTDNMSTQELEILIKDIRNSYLKEGKTIEQEFEKYKTQTFSNEKYPKQLRRLSDSDIAEMIEMIDIELNQEGTSVEQELQEFKINLINNTNARRIPFITKLRYIYPKKDKDRSRRISLYLFKEKVTH